MPVVPLDDAAFYELMTQSLIEMRAWDDEAAERRQQENLAKLTNPDNAFWKTPLPVAKSAAGGLREEFQQFMHAYIKQMDDIEKAAPEGFALPDDHPATLIGNRLRAALEEVSLSTKTEALIQENRRKEIEAERAYAQAGLPYYAGQQAVHGIEQTLKGIQALEAAEAQMNQMHPTHYPTHWKLRPWGKR